MTPEQVEEKICRLKHREPFEPFVVELLDGQLLAIDHPAVAINGGGAVFFGADGGLVDFEFANVRDLRPTTREAAQ